MCNFLDRLYNKFHPIHRFEDGSTISPLDRDTYSYIDANGQIIEVEAYVTGDGSNVDRVLVKSSVEYWKNSNEPVLEVKQLELLAKFKRYFEMRGITFRVDLSAK